MSDIDEHEQRIRSVFTKAFTEHGWVPVYDPMSMDEYLAQEPDEELSDDTPDGSYAWPSAEQPDLELQHLKREEAAAVAEWARKALIYWLAGDGLHPFQILQRFYAICYARYQPLLGPLNGTWLAKILGQGRAAFSALMQRLFNVPVRMKTGTQMIVPGQKDPKSRRKYADNARKHAPRRNATGDFYDGGAPEAEPLTQRMTREELKKLIQAKEAQEVEAAFNKIKAKKN